VTYRQQPSSSRSVRWLAATSPSPRRSQSWTLTSTGWWRRPPRSSGLFGGHRHRQSTATLLIVAGDNPDRLRSEASFASLCGVAPIEASSGKVVRHRLNRGGNREANRALYMICLARMRRDLRTQQYVARRTAEGKSKREIICWIKRYS
jgi:hypothetical protein